MFEKLPVIETKRLILREITLNDTFDMYEYASLLSFGPMAGWEPHKTVSETAAYSITAEAETVVSSLTIPDFIV